MIPARKEHVCCLFGRVIEMVIGVVFAYSATIHLGNPYLFLEAVRRYDLLPGSTAVVIASWLMFLALFVGVSLALGLLREAALRIVFLLLAVFCVAQVVTLSRGLVIGCGCFGVDENPISWWTVGRTGALWAMTCVAIRMKTVDRQGEPGEGAGQGQPSSESGNSRTGDEPGTGKDKRVPALTDY